jgi:hypothetical protein
MFANHFQPESVDVLWSLARCASPADTLFHTPHYTEALERILGHYTYVLRQQPDTARRHPDVSTSMFQLLKHHAVQMPQTLATETHSSSSSLLGPALESAALFLSLKTQEEEPLHGCLTLLGELVAVPWSKLPSFNHQIWVDVAPHFLRLLLEGTVDHFPPTVVVESAAVVLHSALHGNPRSSAASSTSTSASSKRHARQARARQRQKNKGAVIVEGTADPSTPMAPDVVRRAFQEALAPALKALSETMPSAPQAGAQFCLYLSRVKDLGLFCRLVLDIRRVYAGACSNHDFTCRYESLVGRCG